MAAISALGCRRLLRAPGRGIPGRGGGRPGRTLSFRRVSDETYPQADLDAHSRLLLWLHDGESRRPRLRGRLLRRIHTVLHLWRVRAVLLSVGALPGLLRRSLVRLLVPIGPISSGGPHLTAESRKGREVLRRTGRESVAPAVGLNGRPLRSQAAQEDGLAQIAQSLQGSV